jgi:hypothetical protein
VYPNPFQSERPYTGLSSASQPCGICGAIGDCPDAAPFDMPFPPVDISDHIEPAGGPLLRYTVSIAGLTSVMQLNESDAARYGDAAVFIP